MNIYNISCHSSCGSYFGTYLQSVSVIAKNKEEAISHAKEWLKKNGENFLYDEKSWHVQLLGEVREGVFDSHSDSDY